MLLTAVAARWESQILRQLLRNLLGRQEWGLALDLLLLKLLPLPRSLVVACLDGLVGDGGLRWQLLHCGHHMQLFALYLTCFLTKLRIVCIVRDLVE